MLHLKKVETSFAGMPGSLFCIAPPIPRTHNARAAEIKKFTTRIAAEKEILEKSVSEATRACGVASLLEVPTAVAALKAAAVENPDAEAEILRMWAPVVCYYVL